MYSLTDFSKGRRKVESQCPVNYANLRLGFLFQGAPKPIAIEPCAGNRAAVLTVFLCLPRGSSGAPPPGQSGKTNVEASAVEQKHID